MNTQVVNVGQAYPPRSAVPPGRHVLRLVNTTGDYQGKDAVLAPFGRLAEEIGGTLRAEVHDLLAKDTTALGWSP